MSVMAGFRCEHSAVIYAVAKNKINKEIMYATAIRTSVSVLTICQNISSIFPSGFHKILSRSCSTVNATIQFICGLQQISSHCLA